jgi:hypothetical protein
MPVFLLEPGEGEAAPAPADLEGVLPRPQPGAERELEAALRARFAAPPASPEPASDLGSAAAEHAGPEPEIEAELEPEAEAELEADPGAELDPAPEAEFEPSPEPRPTRPADGNGAATAPASGLAERVLAAAARLRDPAFRGEVLPLVLRLAAETFPRVAVFMIREGAALGMAQAGLPGAGGPDDSGIRRVALRADEPAWFRRVLETREPGAGPPSDAGDLRLSALLGSAPPSRAFVAPLATGSAVVALLYADTLPGDGPLPETGALEALLRAAGQALDRALRDRARA